MVSEVTPAVYRLYQKCGHELLIFMSTNPVQDVPFRSLQDAGLCHLSSHIECTNLVANRVNHVSDSDQAPKICLVLDELDLALLVLHESVRVRVKIAVRDEVWDCSGRPISVFSRHAA